MKEMQIAEKRSCPRFKTKDRAFVVFDSQRLGEIVDIGMNGLAARYLVDHSQADGEPRTVGILFQGFYLGSIPARTIADREEELLPMATTVTRIAALQFGELTPEQQAGLELFINRHTLSPGR